MTAPKPLDIGRPPEARMFVQKVGTRWRSWVEIGACVIEHEYGTYSQTRARAEKKARRLAELAKPNPNPPEEVDPL